MGAMEVAQLYCRAAGAYAAQPTMPSLFGWMRRAGLEGAAELWPSLTSIWMVPGASAGDLAPRAERHGVAGQEAPTAVAVVSRAGDVPAQSGVHALEPTKSTAAAYIEITGAGTRRRAREEVVAHDRRGRRRAVHSVDGGGGDRPPLSRRQAADAGTRASTKELEVADYDALFKRRTIYWGVRERMADTAPLYKRLLGDAWWALPDPVRTMRSWSRSWRRSGRGGPCERGAWDGTLRGLRRGAVPGFPKQAATCR